MMIETNNDRFVELMKTQAAIGGTENGGLHRLALSDADKEVRDWFVGKLEDAGLSVRVDEFGNIFGRRDGTDGSASPVLLGSHLDSQPYGGIYDGALGVIGALEVILTLNENDIQTDRPIEVVNWTNEEGARFNQVMQGSGVWADTLDRDTQYAYEDEDGKTVEEELERIGYKGSAPARPRESYDSYVELHIEQGPRLERENTQIGILEGFVGLSWGSITFRGQANHSGTTPMDARNDALVAAADVVAEIREIAETVGTNTVGTAGSIAVEPGSINVVPSETTVTWDFRDADDATVSTARERIIERAAEIASKEGVAWEYEDQAQSSSVNFPTRMESVLSEAADEFEYTTLEMFGGAVHDAANCNSVCDAGMVFVPSKDGKSHVETEYTSWDDCYRGVNVLASATYRLANR